MVKKIICFLFVSSLCGHIKAQDSEQLLTKQFINEATKNLNDIRHTIKYCQTEHEKVEEITTDLVWSDKLKDIAQYHASNMIKNNFFAHKDLEGNSIGIRATNFGYKWKTIGENLAAGQTNLTEVLKSWMASPGHCKNIINNSFTQFGLIMIKSDTSQTDYKNYWVLILAKPQ